MCDRGPWALPATVATLLTVWGGMGFANPLPQPDPALSKRIDR